MELLKKFFNGEVALWKSYWLIFVLLSFPVVFVAIFLATVSGLLAALILIIWTVYVNIGVWKSSSNYQGSKVWAVLAKIAVIINTLYACSLIFGFSQI